MSQSLDAIPTREFPCPRCKKPARWAENTFRPFCSDRVPDHDQAAQASDETNDFAEE
jgi:endogenous inhibitor of DNA gyrase (YacG/DUF329 family)